MSSAFTLIEDTVLGSPAASITFNTSLTSYTKFRLTIYAIKDGVAGSIYVRLNGDTGNNYARQYVLAEGTTVAGGRANGDNGMKLAAGFAANGTAIDTLEISKPLTTTPARVTRSTAFIRTTVGITLEELVYEWNNTADLISSISILASAGDFAANTRAVLEGAAP